MGVVSWEPGHRACEVQPALPKWSLPFLANSVPSLQRGSLDLLEEQEGTALGAGDACSSPFHCPPTVS